MVVYMITVTKENKKQIEKCDYMVIRKGEFILGYEVENKVTGNVKRDEINLGQIGKFSKLENYTLNIDNISWKHFIKVGDNLMFSLANHTNQLLKEIDFISMSVELNIIRSKKHIHLDIARISCPKNELDIRWTY